jgi:hypothetical protein
MTTTEARAAVARMSRTARIAAPDAHRFALLEAGRHAPSLVDENDQLRYERDQLRAALNQSCQYSPDAESEWDEAELREERDAALAEVARLRERIKAIALLDQPGAHTADGDPMSTVDPRHIVASALAYLRHTASTGWHRVPYGGWRHESGTTVSISPKCLWIESPDISMAINMADEPWSAAAAAVDHLVAMGHLPGTLSTGSKAVA